MSVSNSSCAEFLLAISMYVHMYTVCCHGLNKNTAQLFEVLSTEGMYKILSYYFLSQANVMVIHFPSGIFIYVLPHLLK